MEKTAPSRERARAQKPVPTAVCVLPTGVRISQSWVRVSRIQL
jgi:hypothetical protein